MVARGGIEPPTRGFSGCGLTFRLTGQRYGIESIQGVPRKQGDARGKPRKLKTDVLVQNLVQTTPDSPRRTDKTPSLHFRLYNENWSRRWTRSLTNTTSRDIWA